MPLEVEMNKEDMIKEAVEEAKAKAAKEQQDRAGGCSERRRACI